MFVCNECGARAPRWQGRCNHCGAWSSLEAQSTEKGKRGKAAARDPPALLALDSIDTEATPRRPTSSTELDRVLGGGAVPGSVVLFGGEPGIGKSTLLLAVCAGMAGRAVYACGEEAPSQIARRARRLGVEASNLMLLDSSDTTTVAAALHNCDVCVVDSVQTLRTDGVDGAQGGPAQVRAAAEVLIPAARASGACVFLVGQVTKEGGLAGPRTLEHAVDTVLLFEGDRHLAVRALRAVKNRFGPTDEIGLFEMRDDGLREVRSGSDLLLDQRGSGGPGAVIAGVVSGRRALCVEVQALLVGDDRHGARRRAQGLDQRRAELLVGVVESLYCGAVSTRDVFLNVVGGISVQDTGLDLAVTAAVFGAQLGRSVDQDSVVFGEVGLRGEVRAIPRSIARLKEARAMGFARAYVPRGTSKLDGIDTVEVSRVDEVFPDVVPPD